MQRNGESGSFSLTSGLAKKILGRAGRYMRAHIQWLLVRPGHMLPSMLSIRKSAFIMSTHSCKGQLTKLPSGTGKTQ